MELRVARRIDNRARSRVQGLSDSEVVSYLHDSTMSLGVALDQWHHHSAPSDEVTLAVDAIVALWTEAEERGLSDRT